MLYLVRTKQQWLFESISFYPAYVLVWVTYYPAHELVHLCPRAQALKTCADEVSPIIAQT